MSDKETRCECETGSGEWKGVLSTANCKIHSVSPIEKPIEVNYIDSMSPEEREEQRKIQESVVMTTSSTLSEEHTCKDSKYCANPKCIEYEEYWKSQHSIPLREWGKEFEQLFDDTFRNCGVGHGNMQVGLKDFIAQVEQQAYERGKNRSLDFISGLQTSIFGQQMQIDALLEELKGRNDHSLLSKLREKIATQKKEHKENCINRSDGYGYLFRDCNSDCQANGFNLALDKVEEMLSELQVKE